MEEVVRGVTPSGELKSHLTTLTYTHLRSPTWIILALYSCYMSHIISYPSSACLEFKEMRVCPCGPAITHPETVPFVWCFIDVLFQNEARISHFTLDLFFILKSILDVFWRSSKFISDQPQLIRFGSISDFRKPVKRPSWHASNRGCFVMMIMMMASPWRTNISITHQEF